MITVYVPLQLHLSIAYGKKRPISEGPRFSKHDLNKPVQVTDSQVICASGSLLLACLLLCTGQRLISGRRGMGAGTMVRIPKVCTLMHVFL